MNKFLLKFSSSLFLAVAITACDKDDDIVYNDPQPVVDAEVFSASGDSLGIAGKIADFRTALGAGHFAVNWDGVPANVSDVDNFPGDFFGASDANAPAGRKRGLITSGAPGFRVSTKDFSDIDLSYDAEFDAFSKAKTFMSIGSAVSEASFRIAGTTTPGSVKGFGVVFSDVDDPGSTTLQFYNGTKNLGVFKVAVRKTNGGFSFLGVRFPNEVITRVVIKSGDAVLAAGVTDKTAGGNKDLVVMDDFFYSNPLGLP